jgi:hypothetical protein
MTDDNEVRKFYESNWNRMMYEMVTPEGIMKSTTFNNWIWGLSASPSSSFDKFRDYVGVSSPEESEFANFLQSQKACWWNIDSNLYG